MVEHKFYCPVCGAELIEKHAVGKCIYCGKEEETDYICPNGHYVCEDCRILSQKEITIKYLSYSKEKDVLKIMIALLKHPSFNMFGKEHHFVLGPVVLTALKNQGKLNWDLKRNEALIKRTEFLPYGICGSIGTCGACSSVGATLSTLLKATYMSDRERSIVLDATSECLKRIARDGGLRCCKESVYVGLMVLNEYLKEYLNLDMELPDKIVCAFNKTNPECKKERCEFYNGKT
jgi:hypothetical protein